MTLDKPTDELLRKIRNTLKEKPDYAALQLSYSLILIKIAKTDGHICKSEQGTIIKNIHEFFDIDLTSANKLYQNALKEIQFQSDITPHVELLLAHFSHTKIEELLSFIEKLICVDGSLDDNEVFMLNFLKTLFSKNRN